MTAVTTGRLAGHGSIVPAARDYLRDCPMPTTAIHETIVSGTDNAKTRATAFQDVNDVRIEVAARQRHDPAEHIAALEKAIRSRDEVLAIVSHDLRNPLATINTSAALLQDVVTSEDERIELLAMIRNSCRQMQALVADLLDVSRIEGGGFTVDRTRVEVADVMQEMRRMFESTAAEKGICFEVEASRGVPLLYADRGRLLQILSNLVSNAIRVTDEGTVRLTIDRDKEMARFSVTDTGPGIPAEELPHLFDRFWQARSSRRGGAGLGLAIAKGFVEAHQGTIEVTSEVGKGSLFSFAIPCWKNA